MKNETTNLAEDEVVGAEDLPVGPRAHRVHGSGLEVEEHGARDVATWGGENEFFFFFFARKRDEREKERAEPGCYGVEKPRRRRKIAARSRSSFCCFRLFFFLLPVARSVPRSC